MVVVLATDLYAFNIGCYVLWATASAVRYVVFLPSKTCFGGATTADFKVVCNHCQEHCAAISLGLSVAPFIIFLLLLMQSFLCFVD